MELHHTLTDEQFELQFRNCSLDASVFTHEAHLRLAWIHLHKYGLHNAILQVNAQLLDYVTALGAESKFNKTLTTAAVKMVHHFMSRTAVTTFPEFIGQWPRLKTNFKDLVKAHYSIDVFRSTEAKAVYLEPDLLPF